MSAQDPCLLDFAPERVHHVPCGSIAVTGFKACRATFTPTDMRCAPEF